MDGLLGKAVGKVLGGDDERPQGLQQGGGNLTHGGAYPAGGGYPHDDDDDLRGAASIAAKEAPEDQSFFDDILGKLLQDKPKAKLEEEDLDEDDAVQSHRQFFGFGGDSGAAQPTPASTSSLGSAAAMQALKMFTSSDAGAAAPPQSQNAFVGLAMAQAAKLFDAQASQGNVEAGADKQSAVRKAGEMALKMYLKSKGGAAGGAGVGGMGGLLDMAGKFMK
ncbi:hypothetical protein CHGG_01921 [Chaetomium globosum CBS 148.51]|uniref:DUF7721 domain-containing protein n=1 Tax=Chaetomium globosum (strain ATCC 6205 / CBS 148.51 / DSM 1962 / NBRC 6347 / NRRL 1970) TaxID=306901 RepID=Q2HCY3_CHAGB|nr:uncharacterized protein CHGG_01921 [Chaetomium globosum CBS 148.51]EAQ93686.1 hypothetical protein CHGG_01921 [Chaetomium globosum CBS 148.51]